MTTEALFYSNRLTHSDFFQAANYMDIQPLLMLTCAQIASLIKSKRRDSVFFCMN